MLTRAQASVASKLCRSMTKFYLLNFVRTGFRVLLSASRRHESIYCAGDKGISLQYWFFNVFDTVFFVRRRVAVTGGHL